MVIGMSKQPWALSSMTAQSRNSMRTVMTMSLSRAWAHHSSCPQLVYDDCDDLRVECGVTCIGEKLLIVLDSNGGRSATTDKSLKYSQCPLIIERSMSSQLSETGTYSMPFTSPNNATVAPDSNDGRNATIDESRCFSSQRMGHHS